MPYDTTDRPYTQETTRLPYYDPAPVVRRDPRGTLPEYLLLAIATIALIVALGRLPQQAPISTTYVPPPSTVEYHIFSHNDLCVGYCP